MLVLKSPSLGADRFNAEHSLFACRCVSVECYLMSSMLQSGLSDFSPSCDLVNWNGFAVKEALILDVTFILLLMFSACGICEMLPFYVV